MHVGCDRWVTLVLVTLGRAAQQNGAAEILAQPRGEFLGSFHCRDFELTSRKVFGKLSFNILCPGHREVALVLPQPLNSRGPALVYSSRGFGLVVLRLMFDFRSSLLLLLHSHRGFLVLFLFLFQSCMKNH